MKRGLTITIDGPAGSGKSTIAKLVARRLNYLYIDTGAMYRAVTWKALQEKIDLKDEEVLVRLAQRTEILLKKAGDGLEVYVDGQNVTGEIRLPQVTNNVFYLARLAGVRERMVKLQREMGEEGGVVVEGRDIGTVVFPRADYKFYLDASLQERTRRRFEELRSQGHKVELNEIGEEIKARDGEDKGRRIAPLKIAEGAIVIDSTEMRIEEEVSAILKYIREN
ncbi:(d)CMP kinase [candidate division NPL-UPA2 bacterium]|nr:(d)CMP kinase [candidate division NPL-UPA2 bacterium]